MAAASSNPWNETPARRPSAQDFGAGSNGAFLLADEDVDQFENDISPIKDGTQPYAAMFNRVLEGITAAAASMPALSVSVRFTGGGVPEVASFVSPRTTRKIEDIECVDDGTGITTVRVVDTTLPPVIGNPRATVNEGTNPTIKATAYAVSGWRGATVETRSGGTLTNLEFNVEIM